MPDLATIESGQPTRLPLGPLAIAMLMLLALVLFTVGLVRSALWPPDEPRFAEVAREMSITGDYLVPRVNGEVYNEKPPLLFWAMVVAAVPFGEVNELAARMPSVLSGLLTLWLTILLANRLFGGGVALWAGLILLSSYRFWWQARTGQIDMLLTACMTTGLYALLRWDEDRRSRWLWLLYAALGAGLLAKGPPALVFPLLFILTYYRKDRDRRRATHWVVGTIFALALVALWFVPARLAGADATAEAVQSGIGGNLFRNTIGRLFLGVSKAQAPWYYATTIPVDLLPWSLFLPWTLVWTWRNRRGGKAMRFLLCWVVPALIFFSISIGKRAIYILPLFPAFAILTAASIEALLADARTRWLRNTGVAFAAFLGLLGGTLAVLPATPLAEMAGAQVPVHGIPWLSGVTLALGLAVLVWVLRSGGRSAPAAMATAMVVLLPGVVYGAFPTVNSLKSARAICAPVRTLAEGGVDFRLYSVGFSREEYIFYSRHFHEERFTTLIGEIPSDLDELRAMAKLQKHARKTIAEAVAEVPVADLENITPGEREALRQSIDAAIAQDEALDEVLAFERALIREIDAFAAEFAVNAPAFLFVQEEDWRWLIALMTSPPDLMVIRQEGVGRRNVLLIANAAGKKALAAKASAAAPAKQSAAAPADPAAAQNDSPRPPAR